MFCLNFYLSLFPYSLGGVLTMYFARYFLLFSISLHSLRASPRSSFQKGWDTFSYLPKEEPARGGRKKERRQKETTTTVPGPPLPRQYVIWDLTSLLGI